MIKEYKFDKVYLKSLLDRCYDALQSKNLSSSKRESIKSDILFLENALVDKFELANNNVEISQEPFELLKAEFILYLKVLYRYLGEKGIVFLVDLYKSGIFTKYYKYSSLDVPVDIVLNNTISTYEQHVPFLLPEAKKILSLKPTPHVFITKDSSTDSFCHLCEFVDESFIVANIGECSSILCHEVEHGIEDRLHVNGMLSEAGPIFIEMLYTDRLYRTYGINDYISLSERIEDTGDYLDYLIDFLNLIKALAKRKFNISTSEFIKIFNDNVELTDGDVEGYLREENPIEEIRELLDYLFSFLKSIELYSKVSGDETRLEKQLMSIINAKGYPIPNEKEAFCMYDNYVQNITRKI